MLEWLDSVYARLFSYLENSPLGKNTYVMVMSDNGPQLLIKEKGEADKMVSASRCGRACLRCAPATSTWLLCILCCAMSHKRWLQHAALHEQ